MEATFVINPQEIDEEILKKILEFIKSKKHPVTITITTSS